MTTELDATTVDAEAVRLPRARIGYFAGAAMLLTAVILWGAAYLQLRFLSPPVAKLVASEGLKITKQKDRDAVWAFPWRGVGADTARLAALAAIASALVCASVRTWWAWGATLVAAPLAANWYISMWLLLPALVVVDKMRI